MGRGGREGEVGRLFGILDGRNEGRRIFGGVFGTLDRGVSGEVDGVEIFARGNKNIKYHKIHSPRNSKISRFAV
jgi:hypothetical protein